MSSANCRYRYPRTSSQIPLQMAVPAPTALPRYHLNSGANGVTVTSSSLLEKCLSSFFSTITYTSTHLPPPISTREVIPLQRHFPISTVKFCQRQRLGVMVRRCSFICCSLSLLRSAFRIYGHGAVRYRRRSQTSTCQFLSGRQGFVQFAVLYVQPRRA